MTPPLAWRPRPARRVARHGTMPVVRPAADDAHPVTASAAASTGRREPIRQPARPKIRTRPARRPSRAERRRTGPPGWQGIPQSGKHSGCPCNGTERARVGKASGSTDRSSRPDAVRYMSVTIATPCPTAAHDDTRRDKKKTARRAAFPQPAGRFRRWWQVLGSNQRRLSRRSYSPLAPPEFPPADQRVRASRVRPWPPPSAMRPCAPGLIHGRGGKGHGRGRWERLR